MKKDTLSIQIQLTPDTRAEIYLRVVDEPKLPTPNEPDVSREPSFTEWAEIATRMKKLDRMDVKQTAWPVKP